MADATVRRSKRLSRVLRHRPDSIGITLDPHGWVDVDVLLVALAQHGEPLTRDQLAEVVATNDKQRFAWDVETDRIRAQQGHSVGIDLDLSPAAPPDVLFHGTAASSRDAILAEGLDRRGRHHVHLSPDVGTAQRVGARRGAHIVLRVDARRMAADGHRFWVTGNGVWLADAVPAAYLSEVSDPSA